MNVIFAISCLRVSDLIIIVMYISQNQIICYQEFNGSLAEYHIIMSAESVRGRIIT